MQLAVLADELSMVWTEPSEDQKQSAPYMQLSGLDGLGVVKLLGEYPEDVAAEVDARLGRTRTLEDIWTFQLEDIDAFAPLIFAQIEARGRPLHPSLFRLLRAIRVEQDTPVAPLLKAVPANLRHAAEGILRNETRVHYEYELPFMSNLEELRITSTVAIKEGFRIAGAAPTSSPVEEVGAKGAQLYGLVLEELLQSKIEFPVPASIRDIIALRSRPEIADFRSYLLPFLDAVAVGDEEAIKSLRKSIKSCVGAFRRFPVTKRLSHWTGYASLGLGVAEVVTGLIGPSIGVGVVAFAMQGLAKKWEKQSSWLYLAKR